MTTKYCCDRCGKTMDFAEEKIVCLRVGAEITAKDFETNKVADVCPTCWPHVERLIKNTDPQTSRLDVVALVKGNLTKVIDTLKIQGFVVYKKG